MWSTDITYVRLRHGFVYLMAIADWHSRYLAGGRQGVRVTGRRVGLRAVPLTDTPRRGLAGSVPARRPSRFVCGRLPCSVDQNGDHQPCV